MLKVIIKISAFLQQKSSRSNIFIKRKNIIRTKNITTLKVKRGTAEVSGNYVSISLVELGSKVLNVLSTGYLSVNLL